MKQTIYYSHKRERESRRQAIIIALFVILALLVAKVELNMAFAHDLAVHNAEVTK